MHLGFGPINDRLRAAARSELRGKDLACTCAHPAPYEQDLCHGSILLKIATDMI
ncbi:DUF4326 domain-containing protein [Paraburkholderia youngii]|uniref:DUF4326 domain-containing protein n=1 Tax=Paraburkholderia youngii TaxID=2782701 RepID=UPI003D1E7358